MHRLLERGQGTLIGYACVCVRVCVCVCCGLHHPCPASVHAQTSLRFWSHPSRALALASMRWLRDSNSDISSMVAASRVSSRWALCSALRSCVAATSAARAAELCACAMRRACVRKDSAGLCSSLLKSPTTTGLVVAAGAASAVAAGGSWLTAHRVAERTTAAQHIAAARLAPWRPVGELFMEVSAAQGLRRACRTF